MQKRSLARRVMLIAALFATAVVFVLRTEAAGDTLCSTLRREIPQRLGYEVGIAKCRIDPLSQTVKLTGVSVFEPGREDPLVAAEEAEVSLRNVLPGSVTLDWVKLVRPRVALKLKPPAEAAPEQRQGCALSLLDHLKVQHLEVTGAALDVEVEGRATAQVDGLDVEWRQKRGVVTARVELKGGAMALADGRRARLSRSVIEAELDVDDEVLSLQRAEAGVDGVTVTTTGSIEALCDAEPKLALNAQVFVPVATAVKLSGAQVPNAGGTLWSRLQVNGRPSALSVKAELQGAGITVAEFTPGDFTARVAWAGKELTIEDFFSKAGNGWVRLSGNVKLEGGYPARFKVETEGAGLAKILERASIKGAWADLAASVKGTLSGTILPKPNLQGDFEAHATKFTLAARAYDAPHSDGPTILEFPRGDATLHLAVLADHVEMSDIKVSLGAGHTRAQGSVSLYYDTARGIEVHVAADPVVLADFGHIVELPWAGVGSARVDITGPYADVAILGQVQLHDFKFASYSLGVVQTPLRFRGELLHFEAISGQKGKTQYF
ncbi:MAG: translocation/assembly module TamB, partial [Myxococcaceae bacterium]|nr:translocation/assembly module TamB [Myxococcaceae bacterium]